VCKQVSIIGLGLIGTSLGRALARTQDGPRVCGYDSSRDVCQVAARYIPAVAGDLKSAVMAADLIVLAVPIQAMEPVAHELAPWCPPESVITDTGSVKTPVVRELEKIFGSAYVGGHPMAGNEGHGPEASDAQLFTGAPYALTPTRKTSRLAVQKVEHLVELVGAYPLFLAPEEHDSQVGTISHLPHVLAAALTLATRRQERSHLLAAGGWRDTTRVAEGHEDLYASILHANRPALLTALGHFTEELEELKRGLDQGEAVLRQRLQDARRFRRQVAEIRGWSR